MVRWYHLLHELSIPFRSLILEYFHRGKCRHQNLFPRPLRGQLIDPRPLLQDRWRCRRRRSQFRTYAQSQIACFSLALLVDIEVAKPTTREPKMDNLAVFERIEKTVLDQILVHNRKEYVCRSKTEKLRNKDSRRSTSQDRCDIVES